MSGRCRKAAVRAYRELTARGVADRPAFLAAVAVYRNYHPEEPVSAARDRVADWIDAALTEPEVATEA